MLMICLDVEGVLLPELWQSISEVCGLENLKKTTRDEPNYQKLMSMRIQELRRARVSYSDVIEIVRKVEPLPGALEFLHQLRSRFQVSLISDSFYEFLQPLSTKLAYPTIYCHHLTPGPDGFIEDWQPRLVDQKPQCVRAFQSLNFRVFAAGDSFNDLGMLRAADYAAFIDAPQHISKLNPHIKMCSDYSELLGVIDGAEMHLNQCVGA